MEVTLGGDRLGSGNRQKVELHNYQMNSFNQEQDFKSSMAPGILYPFLKLVGTNHGTFDIDLDSFVRTLPTKGPLFGSFKLQIDIFNVPFRLYQGVLHNNPVSLGLNMDKVYLPKLVIGTTVGDNAPKAKGSNDYNYQVHDTALMKYLGLSGIGETNTMQTNTYIYRRINAIPALAYYDIFKNYYANKQEQYAYVITPGNFETTTNNIEIESCAAPNIIIEGNILSNLQSLGKNPNMYLKYIIKQKNLLSDDISITIEGANGTILIKKLLKTIINDEDARYNPETGEIAICLYNGQLQPATQTAYKLITTEDSEKREETTADIELHPFKLDNIDKMRSAILQHAYMGSRFEIGFANGGDSFDWNETSGDGTGLPYSTLVKETENKISYNAFIQNGLVVKTYQSDLFNNWLDTSFVDGINGISQRSAIGIVDNKFTMDAFLLGEKVYDYLNRVLVGGGTYEDWQDATYGEGATRKCETPMYIGGMSAEVMFEEVINNSESDVNNNYQPLGSLGGKGTQVGKKGGTNIHVRCDEPCYVIGIASLTPRICYTQGNDWDLTELDSIDDLHKPALDGIGFQNLMVEQMAWWDTLLLPNGAGATRRSSAGKQTAWINYQTAVDKAYGDFANENYGFMVLSRHYERVLDHSGASENKRYKVNDITTYIDPSKYNYAFAATELDSQNFWVQIHSNIVSRRKMGAQQIPNL